MPAGDPTGAADDAGAADIVSVGYSGSTSMPAASNGYRRPTEHCWIRGPAAAWTRRARPAARNSGSRSVTARRGSGSA